MARRNIDRALGTAHERSAWVRLLCKQNGFLLGMWKKCVRMRQFIYVD